MPVKNLHNPLIATCLTESNPGIEEFATAGEARRRIRNERGGKLEFATPSFVLQLSASSSLAQGSIMTGGLIKRLSLHKPLPTVLRFDVWPFVGALIGVRGIVQSLE